MHPLLQRRHAIMLTYDFEGYPLALQESMAAGVVGVLFAISREISGLIDHECKGLLVPNEPAEVAAPL